jgi:cation diffusion facilitator CzcD-associated flavoprotein CzcO
MSGPSVAIIGTGFGGLCMAIQLKRAGFDHFTLFERAASVGGTWRDNSYPGAACDVPSHLYSFSFEVKPDWSRKFSEQPEILAYLRHCAEKYDLLRHTRFNTEIEGADFDASAGVWRLRTTGGERFEANVLVSACGQLNRPAIPKLRGLESFAGVQFHSARWNHEYPLDGKQVAVVGTGASAIQFVPHVAARAGHLTLFQRTPPWIMPKPDRPYSTIEKTLFARIPGIRALHRAGIYWSFEWRYLGFKKGSLANRLAERFARRHIMRSSAPELLPVVMPDYALGCKRILISNDYHQTLSRPNVTVVTDDIREVQPSGIVDARGTLHPVDAIIYGTGFQSTDFLAPMKLVGQNGRELNQAWREGAEAYLGITVAGFPNLFMLYGPNTNLAHNSIIFMLESQVRYVMGAIRALADKRLSYIDLKPERLRAYNDEVQSRLSQSVWDSGCSSWYKNDAGKNTNNWPGFTFEYRRRTRRIDLEDYHCAPR